MKRRWKISLVLILLWTGSVSGALYDAPPDIKATLPKFCWGQYVADIDRENPEYTIQGCGHGWNHYCPGLVKMKQVDKAKTNGERLGLLAMARTDMIYTQNHIAEYPDCFLHPHVKAQLQRINFQVDMIKLTARKR